MCLKLLSLLSSLYLIQSSWKGPHTSNNAFNFLYYHTLWQHFLIPEVHLTPNIWNIMFRHDVTLSVPHNCILICPYVGYMISLFLNHNILLYFIKIYTNEYTNDNNSFDQLGNNIIYNLSTQSLFHKPMWCLFIWHYHGLCNYHTLFLIRKIGSAVLKHSFRYSMNDISCAMMNLLQPSIYNSLILAWSVQYNWPLSFFFGIWCLLSSDMIWRQNII